MPLNPVKWLGSSRSDIRELRDTTQHNLEYELFRVQLGLLPTDFRPMPSVGSGTYEIRVTDADGISRLMYVAKFRNTVHVLHVFEKKTQRTSRADIDKARQRYKEAKDG